jgi:hypothetical protein
MNVARLNTAYMHRVLHFSTAGSRRGAQYGQRVGAEVAGQELDGKELEGERGTCMSRACQVGGEGLDLCCVESGEEQEKAEGHDENVGGVARQTQAARALALLAVAQFAADVVEVLPLPSTTASSSALQRYHLVPQQRHGQLRPVFSAALGH